jgi:hypothetical protein
MKPKLFTLAAMMMLTFFINNANSQNYCFYVDNQSNQTFYELKIRPTGTNQGFSADLLPEDLIETGTHFWVKTANDDYEVYDVQITDLDGKPLRFSWRDISGNWHESKAFLSVNVKDLHTLVIGVSDEGALTFSVYNYDKFKYGHPCDN